MRNRMYRTVSRVNLEGAEQPTQEELKVLVDPHGVYIDLISNPEESAQLELEPKFKSILDAYGFVSPAAIIIEAYVDFYMSRYEKGHSIIKIRNGLRAEKSFDLILQNMGLYHFYTEPIRDWRMIMPCDFYLPLIGRVEVKSATPFRRSKRCNIPLDRWMREKPDYVVALDNLCCQYLKLIGAMPAKMVESYTGTDYHIPENQSGPAFWSIPCEDMPIKPEALYRALCEAKRRIDALQPIILKCA